MTPDNFSALMIPETPPITRKPRLVSRRDSESTIKKLQKKRRKWQDELREKETVDIERKTYHKNISPGIVDLSGRWVNLLVTSPKMEVGFSSIEQIDGKLKEVFQNTEYSWERIVGDVTDDLFGFSEYSAMQFLCVLRIWDIFDIIMQVSKYFFTSSDKTKLFFVLKDTDLRNKLFPRDGVARMQCFMVSFCNYPTENEWSLAVNRYIMGLPLDTDQNYKLSQWIAGNLLRVVKVLNTSVDVGMEAIETYFDEIKYLVSNRRDGIGEDLPPSYRKWWASNHTDFDKLPTNVAVALETISEAFITIRSHVVVDLTTTVSVFAQAWSHKCEKIFRDPSALDNMFLLCGHSFMENRYGMMACKKVRKMPPPLFWFMKCTLICPETLGWLGRSFIGSDFIQELLPNLGLAITDLTNPSTMAISKKMGKLCDSLKKAMFSGDNWPPREQNSRGDGAILTIREAILKNVPGASPDWLPGVFALNLPNEHPFLWPPGIEFAQDNDVSLSLFCPI